MYLSRDCSLCTNTNRYLSRESALEFVESGKLTSIRWGLFSIGLDLHSTWNSGVSFSSWEIGHMDESIVEGGKDVANSENVVVWLCRSNLRGSVVGKLLLLSLPFLSFSVFLLWFLISLLWLYTDNKSDMGLPICIIYYHFSLLLRYIE